MRRGRVIAVDVYPSLTYDDLRTSVDWLANAFDLEVHDFDDESDAIPHAELHYGRGVVLVQAESPDELHGNHRGQAWVYVAVDDVDQHYEHARAAGARVLNEPHGSVNEGGLRGYSARDLEGNLWSFGTARP
jgi:uncharacterized glyoxalase superfamily protein PhnB